MKIGIIAEGTTDQAVLKNIFKGLKYDSSDLTYLRPDLSMDETDKQYHKKNNTDTFGGLEYVKQDCLERTKLDKFFMIADNQYIIIQLDTLEINQVELHIQKPKKQNNSNNILNLKYYAEKVRESAINLINQWLQHHYQDKLFYAICTEEMEAWLLTIYDKNIKETTQAADPKAKLQHILKGKLLNGEQSCYIEISKPFRKHKNLLTYCQSNESLKLFVDSVPLKITTEII